jgi:glycosyltransferase involved in cell wall biosynthesis
VEAFGVHVVETLENSGTGLNLIDYLESAPSGTVHWVLSLKKGSLYGRAKGKLGWRFIGKNYKYKSAQAIISILWMIRKNRPDIVHSYLTVPNITVRFLKLFASIPVLINEEQGICAWRKGPMAYLFRRTAFAADLFFANSYAVKKSLLERDHIPEKKIIVAYTGFEPANAVITGDPRLEWGIPSGTLIITCVLRFDPVKGFWDSLELARKCISNPKCYFIFVGGGPYLEKAQQTISFQDQRHQILFIGNARNVFNYLNITDVSVSMSHEEGFPRALVESSYMQVPIVATDVGGTNEIVEHGENGYLVPMGDIDEAYKFIIELAQNPEKRKKMGMVGREKMLASFLWSDCASQREEVYQDWARRLR